jgi:hypothetical protein
MATTRVRCHAVHVSPLAVLALLLTPLGVFVPTHTAYAATNAAPLLTVQGNQLVDSSRTPAQPIQLHGVDRSGTEYQCVHNVGIFDPTSLDSLDPTVLDASIQAIKRWHLNAVRVPLNEDCWLGINHVNPAYSGSNYQQAITTYVNHLTANGLVAILDLHWSAPGTQQATGQEPMPDRDHSVTFWRSVAAAFANNLSVVFDLFNEPNPSSWQCWLNGGTSCSTTPWAAGMKDLVQAVRAAAPLGVGASNVILLGGIQFANDLSQWLTYASQLPANQANNLAASWHVYDFDGCITTSCWTNTVAPVAQQVPIVTGEFGEKSQSDPGFQFVTTLLTWLDGLPQKASYVGWTWNAWNSWDSLIADYTGIPDAATYGITYCRYLAGHATVTWLGPGPAVCVTP